MDYHYSNIHNLQELHDKYGDDIDMYKVRGMYLYNKLIKNTPVDWKTILTVYRFTEDELDKIIDINSKHMDIISIYQNIASKSDSFIEKHQNKLNWNKVCSAGKISPEFIEKWKHLFDQICWEVLHKKDYLFDYMINSEYVSWYEITHFMPLDEEAIKKYMHNFDYECWINVVAFCNISEEFLLWCIENDKITVSDVYSYMKLDNDILTNLIKKYGANKNDWYQITADQKISEKFMEKFIDNFDETCWEFISIHQKLSKDFIEKWWEKLSWRDIGCYQDLDETFIIKYDAFLTGEDVCLSQKVSLSFLRDWEKTDFSKVSMNTNIELDEDFINEFDMYMDWWSLSSYHNLHKFSDGFIEKHKEKIKWTIISSNKDLDIEFIRKWGFERNKLDLDLVCENDKIAKKDRIECYVKLVNR